ncbi:MAG: hypothetical protein PVG32_21805 [Anaerolineales bacterium]
MPKGDNLIKLKGLLIINAVIAFVYGLSYELAPKMILALYGVSQGTDEIFLARLFGARSSELAYSLGLLEIFQIRRPSKR